MLVLTEDSVYELVTQVGISPFLKQLKQVLLEDFQQWTKFHKSSRHTIQLERGVIELMPIATEEYYSFKYVNGHPLNKLEQKLTIIAFGMLAESKTGYPLLLSSMTLLTAIRTAAVSALASSYLAPINSKCIAIIGCGAQSEFQIHAHSLYFDLKEVRFFDLNQTAMERFARHFTHASFKLIPARSILETIEGADIIITATSMAGKHKLFNHTDIRPGQHICAIGGDAAGKTELDPEILIQSKVVVEYFPQTLCEGEIQNLGVDAARHVYAELWELISGLKSGRSNAHEITVFDAVGFALEDFSVLRLCYTLAQQLKIGHLLNLTSVDLDQSEGLYGLLL